MNTREIVMLVADTNYVPVKYAVMEVTVGSSMANSYVWLKCISNGIAIEDDLSTLKEAVNSAKAPDLTLLKGVIGEYSTTTLDKIVEYPNSNSLRIGQLLIG